MAGLSSTGFSVKRLNEIIASLKASAVTKFSPSLGVGDVLDTSDNSVLGRWISIVADPISELWETAQATYSAFDINQATGVALEQLCALGGVVRNTESASQARLVSRGTYGITIPTGSYVRSANTNKVFEFQENVVLNETACSAIQIIPTTVADSTVYSFTYQILGVNNAPVSVTYTSGVGATQASIINGLISAINTSHIGYITALLVDSQLQIQVTDLNFDCTFNASQFTITKAKKATLASCTELGALPQDADTIQTIQSPLVGWDNVTNPFAAIVGADIETDAALRLRYLKAKFRDGMNTYEAIYAAILVLDGVQQIVIYENETDADFINPPVPKKSFYPIILGGVDDEIAQAIWNNKPAGILSYGTTSVTVNDSQGLPHNISFERPAAIPIYISMTLVKDNTFPSDGVQQIQDSLLTYISTLRIGEDVLYSRLYTPINGATGGFYITSLTIGTSPAPSGTSNIIVPFNNIANLSRSNVIISFI